MSQNHVSKIEHALTFGMTIIALYSVLTHKNEYEAVGISIIYYLYDISKTTPDFIIHHILSIHICFIGAYLKYNNFSTDQSRKLLLNLEITTPIYLLAVYYNNIFTKMLFTLCFIYFRLYKQYNLLNHIETQNEFNNLNIPIYFPYMIYYCMFGLNMYWLTIHIKKACKPFKDPYYIFCHKIIPFIRPLNLSIINFYSTLSNYLYHEDVYSAIMNDKPKKQLMVYSFVNSIVSISSIEPCFYKYSMPVHIIKLIFQLDDMIPIGIDTCFYFSVDAIIIYYICLLFKLMKPFYNLNPLVIHILLIILRQYSKV